MHSGLFLDIQYSLSAAGHPALIGSNTAQIPHIRIAQMLQLLHRFSAPRAAVAVNKQGNMFAVRQRKHLFNAVQRYIPAAGNVSLTVFLLRAHIQQQRLRRSIEFLQALIDAAARCQRQTDLS